VGFAEWDAPDRNAVPTSKTVGCEGTRIYRFKGTIHRLDGAAIEGASVCQWWINGYRLRSQEAFDLALNENIPPSLSNELIMIDPTLREFWLDMVRDDMILPSYLHDHLLKSRTRPPTG
jgi:hypothetical protein